MAVFMFALLGFPIFGGVGFFAKWYVLQAALQAPVPQTTLAVVLVLTTVISAGYYLYVVMVMFMRPRAADGAAPPETPAWTQFVMVACARRDPRDRRRAASIAVRFANVGLPSIERADRRQWIADAAAIPPTLIARALTTAGPQRGPAASAPAHRRAHRIRHLSAVRHPRHRRQGPHRRGGARHRPRVRGDSCAERGVSGEVVVGRDNRPSGDEAARCARRRAHRVRRRRRRHRRRPDAAALLGLFNLGVVGGIQITGSHNPAEYNGFKLSLGTESLHGDDIQELLRAHRRRRRRRRQGTVRDESTSSIATSTTSWRASGRSRAPMKLVYDCGNGAGALVAPQLFARSGSTRSGLFCESDGTFPNHHPDPTVPENLEDLIARGARAKARSSASRSTATRIASAWSTATARSSGATTS